MRNSSVITKSDQAGPYETELFETSEPESIVICSHGNGVRRWDGEHFFHAVAGHYPDHTFLLVDQNQVLDDGCQLNELPTMVARVQDLVARAHDKYPGIPIVVLAHSMGCGIVSQLDLSGVEKVVFVAPAAGDATKKLIDRYGKDIMDGKLVKTSDGLTKLIPKAYVESIKGIVWEDEYRKLLERYTDIYVFESGAEEIIGDERFDHRDMPFTSYKVIPGAKHNYAGDDLEKLFKELDQLL